MDTSQYMNMFLEESMDNLQTLNEALLELEQNPDNMDKLNEIFRVAHTIKGMAATMGFTDVAELTHKMEDVLSEFRDGKLSVTQEVVTVLFDCLDTLEKMISLIEDGSDEKVAIEPIMDKLHKIAEFGEKSPEEPKQAAQTENEKPKTEKTEGNIELNEYDMSVISQAKDKGVTAFDIKVTISENTLLLSIY